MDADDEQRIERLLRRPEALSDAERRRAEQLVEQDPAAQAFASFLRTYYDLLAEERERDRSDRVEAFVDGLFETPLPPVLPLRPYRPQSGPQPTVLAASTSPAADDQRFAVLTTLAAEQDGVLVRVIADREAQTGRVYVLTGASADAAHVIVSFPALGLDLVTDGDGRRTFDLPADAGPGAWADAMAVVRRPVDRCTLHAGNTATLKGPAGIAVRCRYDGTTLAPTLHAEAPDASALLTAEPCGGDGRLLLRLPDPDAPPRPLSAPDGLRLRLYS